MADSEDLLEKKRQKSREMRYKKPLCKDISLEKIQSDLSEWYNLCGELSWFDDEDLEEALGGEEQAQEFKYMFSCLSSDCEDMVNDLNDWSSYVPECFDLFFVAIDGGGSDGYLGFDEYENDYLSINSFEAEWAVKESQKRFKRMTKDEIIKAAKQCFKIYSSYVALKYRLDCLQASIDILKERDVEILRAIKEIEKAYDIADEVSEGFKYLWYPEVQELNRKISMIPPEMWAL
ncbi:MAG: hypothetical protein LUG23_00220 [Oscillospiraceae bacterium]|nr:hypothetical protein [Oscillospiraceae bacterium]